MAEDLQAGSIAEELSCFLCVCCHFKEIVDKIMVVIFNMLSVLELVVLGNYTKVNTEYITVL